jgi:hypothetical protein
MADNVTLDPGVGGASVAADDIAGIHHQRVKVQHGADGSATDVSTASPLPSRLYAWDGSALREVAVDSSGILQVDIATIAAGSATIGDVGVKPRTSGGLSIATDIDLDETELEVKGAAGQLFGWYVYNDGAAEVYVKLYNDTAANVVVGTTVPVMTFGVPAGSAANVFSDIGIAFSAGICAAATTVATTADTTAPAANQVVANFLYA